MLEAGTARRRAGRSTRVSIGPRCVVRCTRPGGAAASVGRALAGGKRAARSSGRAAHSSESAEQGGRQSAEARQSCASARRGEHVEAARTGRDEESSKKFCSAIDELAEEWVCPITARCPSCHRPRSLDAVSRQPLSREGQKTRPRLHQRTTKLVTKLVTRSTPWNNNKACNTVRNATALAQLWNTPRQPWPRDLRTKQEMLPTRGTRYGTFDMLQPTHTVACRGAHATTHKPAHANTRKAWSTRLTLR